MYVSVNFQPNLPTSYTIYGQVIHPIPAPVP